MAPSCSIVFCFFSSLARSTHLSFFFFLSVLSCAQQEWLNPLFGRFSFFFFFFWLSLSLVMWSRLDNKFISENPREVCAFHFPGRVLDCTYTICSHGQSPSPPSHVLTYTLCELTYLMWLVVSSLSPHNLHVLFCSVFTILVLT